ncbi:septum formation initiator [Acinetobacter baumannii]|uniref:septum formation initiator n=1 Tax=Acinetobacter calcoaceticus/baumannii complex TaxID=909768 RepID=UPI001B33ECBD|nr:MULTISPECIES: septum formation initiator [Acinetobacter calcoaceticus/baumannii complex]MBP4064360.1 septum formation initiator [Acinetobacter baumannii]MDH2546064.1 septum formation initiator [Acinetobacter baumannii]MDH2608247.1 septum formation initiator [Acinetobacter baumannii]MDO7231491.1 septum formation initiator [Acinetobacter nosocomialis]MDO7421403.1 septum formation initiator [Acinetobacter baumannii]
MSNILNQTKGYLDSNKWNSQDTTWMLGLFGTAIGAGVLFLPINAGIGGLIPLLITTLLAYPITFFAHRAFARFILSSSKPESGITGVILEYWGANASRIFNLIYFWAIYTILLLYAVAVTNTVESFITHQLHLVPPPRALLSFILICILLFIVRFGQDITVKVMSILVYPFIISLIFMAIWLIPHWNTTVFESFTLTSSNHNNIWMTLWMIFPVLVLSFNHYPIISPFVVKQRKIYGELEADKKCSQIQRYGYILMVCVVMFFVYSCILSLSPQDLASAKEQNISILSYLANHFDTPVIAWAAPLIAFIAIMKSFLGHYIGAHETLTDIISDQCQRKEINLSKGTVDKIIFIFMILTCWFIAYKNPSILDIIVSISGPTGAILVLLLPMYAIHKIPSLAPYRNKVSNIFVTLIGVITVSAIFYGLV